MSTRTVGNRAANALFSVVAVLGLAGPLTAAHAADKTEAKDCQLVMYDSIDLVVSGSDLYVPVSFDGQSGLMTLTLSSGLSFLYDAAATKFALNRRASPVQAYINGARANRLAQFKTLAIGKAKFGKGEFLIDASTKELRQIEGQPLLGALGTEAFTVVDFELDLSRRKLNLFSQEHCKGNVVYWSDDWGSAPLYISKVGTLYFPVELENKKVEAAFETGAATTRLSTDVTKALYGFDASSPGIETGAADEDGEPQAHFRAMQLTAPGMTVRNSRIRLIDPASRKAAKQVSCSLETRGRQSGGVGYSGCENVYPMHLGRNVLERMRFYFATKEKKIYYTLASATKAASPPATSTP